MKNKKIIIFIIILFLTIGVTLAYFTSSSVLENEFNSGQFNSLTEEEFTSPSNWSPGDTTPKTIVTTNEGTIPVMVRVKLEESWTSENGDPLPLTYNGENVAIINFDNTSDWKYDGEYYYYIHELEPGDSTLSPISGITFNINAPSDVSCTNVSGTYTCESTGDGYDGGTYKLKITTETVQAEKYQSIWGKNVNKIITPNPCTYEGTLTQGAEYTNGQYTYRYMQEHDGSSWENITDDGWGVKLTDPTSTDPVTTKLCTSINNKPIVSMTWLFADSQSTSIDLSSLDTSNVTDMSCMFLRSKAISLDLSTFDTSNVTNMNGMFSNSDATTINLTDFDTSKVSDMSGMFARSQATTLNLSSFDTSNVTDMISMFASSQATSIDLSTFDTSSVTNMSSMFNNSLATSINISSFDDTSLTNSNYMFCRVNSNYITTGSNFTITSNMFQCDSIT